MRGNLAHGSSTTAQIAFGAQASCVATAMIPFLIHRRIPFVRRPFYQRDEAIVQRDRAAAERDALVAQRDRALNERDALALERAALIAERAELTRYTGTLGATLQYRQAYFEMRGHVAPGLALPMARPWPRPDNGLSYEQKLLGMLDLSAGRGAEIGPLNIPITSKLTSKVLYVDHLDTDGIKTKYPTLSGIVDIDRPMVNDSLTDTLQDDAPLDYLVASQVFEHVANPIRWLREIAAVLREGGLISLSLPDRRLTFDLLREETRAADIVAAYYGDFDTPDVRNVYDHHSLAGFVNTHWATEASVYPDEVICSGGAVKPKLASDDHLAYVERARNGEYLDVHAWVFTPPSFLLVMAQLAGDGFLPYRLHQFYPTNSNAADRGNSSFTAVLERIDGVPSAKLRESYLAPLGE